MNPRLFLVVFSAIVVSLSSIVVIGRQASRTSELSQALRAEVRLLMTRVTDIERDLRVQFERIAQMQQQLDELHQLIRKQLGRR